MNGVTSSARRLVAKRASCRPREGARRMRGLPGKVVMVVAALVALMSFAFPAALLTAAQTGNDAQSATGAAKPIPRTSWDGKPDLTGVWQGRTLDARAYGLAELERLYQPSAR